MMNVIDKRFTETKLVFNIPKVGLGYLHRNEARALFGLSVLVSICQTEIMAFFPFVLGFVLSLPYHDLIRILIIYPFNLRAYYLILNNSRPCI